MPRAAIVILLIAAVLVAATPGEGRPGASAESYPW